MMRRGLWIAVAVVAVIVLAGLLVFGSFVSAQKQMVAKQEAVRAQWSNVQAVLQRRADLIPNLVATVKGAAQHEETRQVRSRPMGSWTARWEGCWRLRRIIRT
jgi:LemA protein